MIEAVSIAPEKRDPVDERGVSWRFKPLDQDWAFVLINAPVDRLTMAIGRQ